VLQATRLAWVRPRAGLSERRPGSCQAARDAAGGCRQSTSRSVSIDARGIGESQFDKM
jgi:hypothetical protein